MIFCLAARCRSRAATKFISLANELQQRFELVLATQDWHPAKPRQLCRKSSGQKARRSHQASMASSKSSGQSIAFKIPHGAEFAPSFNTSRIAHMFHKGIDPRIDSYSTFFDNAHRRETGLADYLKERAIRDIYLLGLALDYCVKYSALDARQLRPQHTRDRRRVSWNRPSNRATWIVRSMI